MVKVQIRLPSHIAKMLVANTDGWLIIEKETDEGTTVSSLLTNLVTNYPGFREAVFNPDTGSINEQINVILNNELLNYAEIMQKQLADNDAVTLQPLYVGG